MSGRIRTIKPELLEDAVTAGLSDAAFRLFMGVILLSDDYGCFRAEPAFLAGQIWWKAKATATIESAIAELDPLIEWYVVKGQRYGHIRNWEKHQKVAHRGKRRIPEPPETLIESHETLMNVSGETPETLMPDLRPMDHRPSTNGSLSRAERSPTKREVPESDHQRVIATWHDEFVRAKGAKPGINGRSGKAAKELITQFGADEACDMIRTAFTDVWFVRNKCELEHIAKEPNKYRGRLPQLPKRGPPVQGGDVTNAAWLPAAAKETA